MVQTIGNKVGRKPQTQSTARPDQASPAQRQKINATDAGIQAKYSRAVAPRGTKASQDAGINNAKRVAPSTRSAAPRSNRKSAAELSAIAKRAAATRKRRLGH